jgi:hypothetical protein
MCFLTLNILEVEIFYKFNFLYISEVKKKKFGSKTDSISSQKLHFFCKYNIF